MLSLNKIKSGISKFIIVSMVIVTGFSLTACGELDALNDLIATLDRWPDQWEDTLIKAIDRFEKMGTTLSKQIAEDLRKLLNETTMAVGMEFMCSVDFVAERTKQQVQLIRYNRFPNRCDPPEIKPWICLTEPDTVIPYAYPNPVKFQGFNFDLYDAQHKDDMKASIVQDDKIIFPHLGITIKPYNVTVSLGEVIWKTPMDPTKNPRLSLKWTGGQSEIFIKTPQPDFVYSDCVEIDTGVDTDEMTKCPDGYVLSGIRQGMGHCDGDNSPHKIKCCKIVSPNRPDINISLKYDPYRQSTGVDTWDLTLVPYNYVMIGLSGGFGHSRWYNLPHDILSRYFTSNYNLYIDYENSTIIDTNANIFQTICCPPGNVITGFAGGTGHSSYVDNAGHLLKCNPIKEY